MANPMQGLDPASLMMPRAQVPGPDKHNGAEAPREPSVSGPQDGTPASPEEQEIYNSFVGASMMILWDRKAAPKYVQTLRSSPDPKETGADIAAQVGFRVLKGAAEAGTPIPPHIVLAGGMEIASQVGEMAEQAGVKMSPQDVEQVYYLALDKGRVLAQKAGLIDQEAVGRDAAMLDAMGKDGRLDQAMALVDADHKRAYQRQPLEEDTRSSFEADEDEPVKGLDPDEEEDV